MSSGTVRKRSVLLFLSYAIFSFTGFAQTDEKLDSLQTVLKNQKNDTSKVNTLNALSRRYLFAAGNNALSKKFAEDALALSRTLNFKMGSIHALTNLGYVSESMDNHMEAISKFRSALQIAEQTGAKFW